MYIQNEAPLADRYAQLDAEFKLPTRIASALRLLRGVVYAR